MFLQCTHFQPFFPPRRAPIAAEKNVSWNVSARPVYIAHLDLDCFFVSVERIFNPALAGKPVVVGGSPEGRGVVASASYEARAFGIRAAMPMRRALQLCPQVIIARSSFGRYGEISGKLKRRLMELAPLVEQASVDEFYLDFTGCEPLYPDVPAFMKKMHGIIAKEFSLPCSIGLASNKMLSKIAATAAKPNGIRIIPAGEEKAFLAPLPIDVLPGVGAKTGEQLRRYGLKLVADVRRLDPGRLRGLVGSYADDLLRMADGLGSSTLTTEWERKSIGREETFHEDIANAAGLEEELYPLVEDVCWSARSAARRARTITLKLRYADFKTITRAETVEPTNDDAVVFRISKKLLHDNYQRGRGVRLIGVTLSNLVDEAQAALALFPQEGRRRDALTAVDKLRDKFGDDVIHTGRG